MGLSTGTLTPVQILFKENDMLIVANFTHSAKLSKNAHFHSDSLENVLLVKYENEMFSTAVAIVPENPEPKNFVHVTGLSLSHTPNTKRQTH